MATSPAITEQPRRHKLEVCIERLVSCISQLSEASDLYKRMKSTLDQACQDPTQALPTELCLKLCVGDGLEAPIPMPEDPLQRVAYIEEGTAFLAEDVIRLGKQAHEITTEMVQHFKEATEAATAAAAQQPQPPQQAQPPQPPQQARQPQVATPQ